MEAGAVLSDDRRRPISHSKKQQTLPAEAGRVCLNSRPVFAKSLTQSRLGENRLWSPELGGRSRGSGRSRSRGRGSGRSRSSGRSRHRAGARSTRSGARRSSGTRGRSSARRSTRRTRSGARRSGRGTRRARSGARRSGGAARGLRGLAALRADRLAALRRFRRTGEREHHSQSNHSQNLAHVSLLNFSKRDRGRLHLRDPENLRSAVPRPDRPHFVTRSVLIDATDCAVRAVCSVNAEQISRSFLTVKLGEHGNLKISPPVPAAVCRRWPRNRAASPRTSGA